MNARLRFHLILAASLLCSPLLRAQDNPLNDPDLQEALKQAKELQKGGTPANMSDLKKQSDQIAADQAKEEALEKQKQQAALQKQLAEPGPLTFPAWMPATPQFKASGPATKKIVDDQVKIIQTGTSPDEPEAILEAWEKAVADKPVNHISNRGRTNGSVHDQLDLSTRTEPRERVRLEASREQDEKVTQVIISSALPKPGDDE